MRAKGKPTVTAGFACVNEGHISDCYTTCEPGYGGETCVFSRRNTGSISHSFLSTSQNCDALFCPENSGSLDGTLCYQAGLVKPAGGTAPQEALDFLQIWQNDGPVPGFRGDRFYSENPDRASFTPISTPKALFDLAAGVAAGDPAFVSGRFVLTCDLNLRGVNWTPIGIDELRPFCGSFDGAGHSIKNFIVRDRSLSHGGFFGYVKNGVIINLTIDGIIRAGQFAGGLVGCSDGSFISCCCSAAQVSGLRAAGGFVCRNTGTINRCYAVGRVGALRFAGVNPTAAVAVLAAALALLVAAAALGTAHWPASGPTLPAGTQLYPQVPRDPNLARNQDDPIAPAAAGHSLSFELQPEITAERGDGIAALYFKNPGSSNQSAKVELHISDAELLEKLKTTGRSPSEQQALEEAEGYTAEGSRVILGESGAVPPGYSINHLQLRPLPDGTVLPKGDYNVVAYMQYYDSATNEKAMVQTQVPAVLRVG